jgi:uncharacterized protein YceK
MKTTMIARVHVFMISLFILISTGGCGTLIDTFTKQGKDYAGPRIYGGIQLDISAFSGGHMPPPINIMFVFDVPLSLCLDTAILPISLINELLISGGDDEVGSNVNK